MNRSALALALIVALAACWRDPKPPTEGSIFPGTTWITPQQPWRATLPPQALAIESAKTALVAGDYGWLGRIDLTTGRIVAETRVGKLSIDDIALLADARILVVGTRRDGDGLRTEAFVVDGATFATKQITLAARSEKAGYYDASAAALPGGTVAITGPGLPLATYDPASWEVVKVLDEEMNWAGVRASDDAIIAYRSATVYRFDLQTGEKRNLGIGTQVAASKSQLAMRRYVSGKWYVEMVDGTGTKRATPSPIDTFTLDREGRWLVTVSQQTLQIHTLPEGKLWKKLDLGASGRGTSRVQVHGDTLVYTASSLVRRIDLATGNASPIGDPPFGVTAHLLVDNDGSVLAIGNEAWRLVDARVTATTALDGASAMFSAPGETRRFALMNDTNPDQSVVTLHEVGTPVAQRRWALEQDTLVGWLSRSGEVAVELLFGDDDQPGKLVRSDGARIVTVSELNGDANVRDVDLDANLALVEIKGEFHVVELGRRGTVKSKQRLRAPGCEEYADGALERDGKRAYTVDAGDVIVWDRTTGKPLGSLHLEESPRWVMFVPQREELMIVVGNGVVLWSPASGELRTYAALSVYDAGVSPDGKRLALGLGDSRVVLASYDAIRAKATLSRATQIKIPPHCNELDPFAVEHPEEIDEDPEEDVDPCGGVDPCAP